MKYGKRKNLKIVVFLFQTYHSLCFPKRSRTGYNWKKLSPVLYRCETWSLTLKEERKLQVFEDKVLRKISESEKDEVSEQFRTLQTKKQEPLELSQYSD